MKINTVDVAAMEKVLEAFQDYLDAHEYMEVCKTKFGYLLLEYIPERDEFMGVPQIMRTADELSENLLEEIVLDVLEGTDHDLEDATREELEEIRQRQEVYRERLEGLATQE